MQPGFKRSDKRRGTVSLQKREANEDGAVVNAGSNLIPRASNTRAKANTSANGAESTSSKLTPSTKDSSSNIFPVDGFDAASTIVVRSDRDISLQGLVEIVNWITPIVHASVHSPNVFVLTFTSAASAERVLRELAGAVDAFGLAKCTCQRAQAPPTVYDSVMGYLFTK